MTDTTPRTFPAEGELAIAEEHLRRAYDTRPRAFFDLLMAEQGHPYRRVGAVAVVDVRGPLDQRGGWWWDGYDAIVDRVREALADGKVKAVVLAIDSPGGVVAGMLDTARELRALAVAEGKVLWAHAGTYATSAAYALACAADHIAVTEDGAVGSVGVVACAVDQVGANAKAGLNVVVVRSGARKAEPHPDVALTDDAVARLQERVTDLAGSFAAWVAERRGQTADAVLAHEGAVIYARRALDAGFADSIGTLADTINLAARGVASNPSKKANAMTTAKTPRTAPRAEDKPKDTETKAEGGASAADKITEAKGMLDTEQNAGAIALLDEALAILNTGAMDDPEEAAAAAVLRAQAQAVPSLRAEIDALKANLAARDARDTAAARAVVLDRHRARGALTPALEADKGFMGALAPLAPDALDRVLSGMPGAPRAVTPRSPAGTDPAAPGADTDKVKEFAKGFGVDPATVDRVVERERAARAAQAR